MNPQQRESIVDTAKYLRQVRPIDPEEIHEYVPGRPHPAAIRQVLREAAVDLGLVECNDGTFEPPDDEPVRIPAGTIERFPESHGRRLTQLLVERYGPDWPEGDSGQALRESTRRLKEGYFAGREITYDETAALGYAIYHLPDYYAAIQYVFEDLLERRLLGKHLRIVDVGAGPGGPALGIADSLPEDALVEYHAIEPGPAADVLEALLAGTGPNFHPTIHRNRAGDVTPPECDLLVFGNVLSELANPIEVVERYAEALAADGSLLLLSPADPETSTGLREIERSLVDRTGLGVYSPTVRLWSGHEPGDRCWSFDVRPDLEVPPVQRRLDEAGSGNGEFVNVDVQFSYAILRFDGARRIEFDAEGAGFAKLANTGSHVTERIDLAAIKLSHDLAAAGEGANPLFLIGDGSQEVDHYAVLTRETGLNDDLKDAGYGDLLVFESALALWNADEEAYNLVVDDETVVDRVGG